jgi:hypothetical protein
MVLPELYDLLFISFLAIEEQPLVHVSLLDMILVDQPGGSKHELKHELFVDFSSDCKIDCSASEHEGKQVAGGLGRFQLPWRDSAIDHTSYLFHRV